MIAGTLSVAGLERDRRLRSAVVLGGSLTAGLAGSLVIGTAAGTLRLVPLALVGLALIAIWFWRSRPAPVVAFLLGAALIDRYPDPSPGAVAAQIPFWRSVGATHIYPFEVLLGLAVVIWIGRDAVEGRLRLPRSRLSAGLGLLLLVALFAWLHGLGAHGDFTVSLEELRPWLYLAAAYLLASRLLSDPGSLDGVLWALVLGTGLKGVYGIYRLEALSSVQPRPETILEHDETVFFTVYILLTLALWVFGRKGPLRRVATLLLPFVFITDLGNDRRTAWLVLPACLVLLAVVAWIRRPERRRVTAGVVAVSVLLVGGYVIALHNSTGFLATPAHALWSTIRPDPRDLASDNYRTEEIQNLSIDIHQVRVTGLGFGIPYGTPIPMVNVSTTIDPLIFYIPHDTVLWVWLRMGVGGMALFWWTAAAAIVAASRLIRDGDPRVALFGTVVLGALICYLGQGWLDQGLASLRIEAWMGCLLGGVETALVRMRSERRPAALASRRRVGITARAIAVPRPVAAVPGPGFQAGEDGA